MQIVSVTGCMPSAKTLTCIDLAGHVTTYTPSLKIYLDLKVEISRYISTWSPFLAFTSDSYSIT